ncbi:hypothetical protein ACLUTX_28750 [Enterobacterales bacterium AE_CKDN230030158-1A_HGKHYDSX7]
MQTNASVAVPNLNSLYTCDGNIMVLSYLPAFGGYTFIAAIPAEFKRYMPTSTTFDGVTYSVEWHQVDAATAQAFSTIQENNPNHFVPLHMLPQRKRNHLKSVN